jgi:hypothetical protein
MAIALAGHARWHRRQPTRRGRCAVRTLTIAGLFVAMLLAGFGLGRASDRDETVVTAKVSSAEHETQEGYFSLGPEATVMAKPGSELYEFLARQNGREVRVTLKLVDERQLSRLDR